MRFDVSLFNRRQNFFAIQYTVDPVYSERGYSEYPLIVNEFLRTDR
jgi:hypothetical protein